MQLCTGLFPDVLAIERNPSWALWILTNTLMRLWFPSRAQWLPPAKWKIKIILNSPFLWLFIIFIYSSFDLWMHWLEDKQARYANKFTSRQLTKSSLSEQSGKQACRLGFSKAARAFWLWGSTSSWEWKGYANSMQRGWTLSRLQTSAFTQTVRAEDSVVKRIYACGWKRWESWKIWERRHKQCFLIAWP